MAREDEESTEMGGGWIEEVNEEESMNKGKVVRVVLFPGHVHFYIQPGNKTRIRVVSFTLTSCSCLTTSR